jgi:hypothetical protein
VKRRIPIEVHGQTVEILAQIEGTYAVASSRAGMPGFSSLGYAVWARNLRTTPEWQPIVSGLDRDVAVAVAMDMNKISQREPEGAKLQDLLGVLRRYIGMFI